MGKIKTCKSNFITIFDNIFSGHLILPIKATMFKIWAEIFSFRTEDNSKRPFYATVRLATNCATEAVDFGRV